VISAAFQAGRSTLCSWRLARAWPCCIEDGVPDLPDGLVQFVDGVPDLAGPAVLADQPQRGLEIQSRGEDPADYDIVDAPGNPVVIFGEVPSQFR
jgi:hypothetical protein